MEERRHTSKEYERELQEVKDGLLYLGSMVEEAIRESNRALIERSDETAKKVIELDDQIDRLDEEMEEKCIRLLALRQPAARDLRFITTAIKINGHLERIGDMAVNICEKILLLNREPQLKPYIDLPRMSEIAQSMVRESLEALINENLALANQVRINDDLVDNLNEQIFRELLTFMIADPQTIHRAILIMQISKNLERICDHAKGIADMVIYMITGRNVRHTPEIEGNP
ncbi:MAG TPA: phosphate signaling complex protein PhoU [Syntrophales bacterium]|nr:phosphate signaling complex protein PhoU [Syntrophales bacterium]HOL59020.1 phosphate signaling complex protein PhoU [Syntrophales bacterium]HPO34702.1 phosphate signaling complex protein PhoU [Syntrophales bacterium]